MSLDIQMQAFVQKSLDCYPENSVSASVAEQRDYYDALCIAFKAPYPAGITVTDGFIQGKDGYNVPIRRYQVDQKPSKVQIVFAHGGGFVVGSLDSHDDICAEFAKNSGSDLIAIDYRLAPEFHYPDDINDCLAVVDYLLADNHQIVLVGDSAGGTLCACVANARSQFSGSQLLGQVLIYPALAHNMETPSMNEHANAPLLSKDDMVFYKNIRLGDKPEPNNDSLYSPLQTNDFSQLPPTHLFPAEIDPLCDDCAIYADALQAVGVEAVNHLNVGRGLVHCYLRARHLSDKAKACFDEICATIRQLANNY